MIREKKIKSGKLLEVNYYPVTDNGRAVCRGSPKKLTSAAQEKYNHIQRQKRTVRLVCANFDETDIFLTLTFKPSLAPADAKDAKRILKNYLRRVKRFREKKAEELKKVIKSRPRNKKLKEELKKLQAPFKYLYALESKTYQRGIKKGQKSYHFHLFLTGSGEGDRDEYEKIWDGIAVAKRFQPDNYGLDSAAKYISKQKVQSTAQSSDRCMGASRNLKKPDEVIKDGKYTERGIGRVAQSRINDSAYWERRNKNYSFISGKALYNDLNGHWYISILMYRDKEPPPIDVEEWFEGENNEGITGTATAIQLGSVSTGKVP